LKNLLLYIKLFQFLNRYSARITMVQRQTQDESIYSLIPRKPREVEKADRYVSKNKTNLIGEAVVDQKRSQKESHKTMGLPNEHADVDPHTFTKKRSGEPKLKEPEKYHYPDEERKRPPVPRAQDAPPLMGMKTTKNFITTNAVENIMAVPKKPAANLADTRHGDIFPLEESGLVPKYRNKKDFGNTPNYIVKRADEMRRAQEEYDLYVKEHMRRERCAELMKKYTKYRVCTSPLCERNWDTKDTLHFVNRNKAWCNEAGGWGGARGDLDGAEAELGGGHAPVPVSPSCMRQPVPKTHKRTIGSPAEEYRERHRAIRKAQNDLRGLTTPPPNSAPSPTRNNFTRISQQRPNINSNKTRNTSHGLIRYFQALLFDLNVYRCFLFMNIYVHIDILY